MPTPSGRPPGLERGDHVYIRHPSLGPIAVKVLAVGRDGLTGEAPDGNRHTTAYADLLGHKERVGAAYHVIDEGADGAIIQGEDGRRRYIDHRGKVGAPPPAAEKPSTPKKDDPFLGRAAEMHKAITLDVLPIGARAVFIPVDVEHLLKAGGIANRPGLALKELTDKDGRRSKHWVRTMKPQASDRQPAKTDDATPSSGVLMQHGDVVRFRHGDVEGKGRIVGSGADGVTVHDGQREHQVRHEHLLGKAPEAEQAGPMTPPIGTGEPAAPAAENPPPLFDAAVMSALPDKADQPVTDEAELYAKSGEALSHLQEWLDKGKGIADNLGYQTMSGGMDNVDWAKPGGMLFIAPLKGKKRAAEKVASDYGGDWSKLRDVVRCSIAVDTMDQIKSTLAALQAGGMKLAMKPKDRFNKPVPVGYRDLLMNVTMPNGIVSEVQLHVKAMLKAKEEGHKHYETERVLDSKVHQSGVDSLTPEEQSKLRDAQEQQKAIYGQAWQMAMGGSKEPGAMPMEAGEKMTGGQPMAKAFKGGSGKFSFFDHEGAQFRRADNGLSRGVDDVLLNGKWQPYKGSDRLQPALYGDEISDPLPAPTGPAPGDAPQDQGGTLAKSFAETGARAVFFKAAPAPAVTQAKRSLYVHRKVTNGEEIAKHYREQGCTHLVDPTDMHTTVCYSKQPCDWSAMGDAPDAVHVPASEERSTEPLGKDGAIVLHYASDALQARHTQMRGAGASSDYPTYKPHVTVSYKGGGYDKAKPWTGPIHLGPEVRKEITGSYKPPTLAKSIWLFLKSTPSQAQLEAGNYSKPRRVFQGLSISVENPKGSVRSGVSKGGEAWSTNMRHDYGYIRGTLGSDGDHYDCYVGPNEDATHAHVVNTMQPPDFTKPDEQKAMLGFDSPEEAKAAFLDHYDKPGFFGGMTSMPMDDFKAKVMRTRDEGHPGLLKGMWTFFKAAVKGHERHDLFALPTHVTGYERGKTHVEGYTAIRHRHLEPHEKAQATAAIAASAGSAPKPRMIVMRKETATEQTFRPSVGDTVEFLSDRQTEKGPSAGTVTALSPDGQRATIRHSDRPGEEFDLAKVKVASHHDHYWGLA